MVAQIGDRRLWADGEVAGRSRIVMDKAERGEFDDDTFTRFMVVLGWTWFIVLLVSLALGFVAAGITALLHSTSVGPLLLAAAMSVYMGLLAFAFVFQLHTRALRHWGDDRDTFLTRHFLKPRRINLLIIPIVAILGFLFITQT
jgi:hypothetical protein